MDEKIKEKLKLVGICTTAFVSLTMVLIIAHSALLTQLDIDSELYGSVADISEDYDEQTDTYDVKVVKNQQDGKLRIGSPGSEKVLFGEDSSVLIRNLEKGDVIKIITVSEDGQRNLYKKHKVGVSLGPIS